jgi:hypothetical protein
VALLLLPTAFAGSASGSFLAAGPTRLPAGAQLRVAPLAILADDAGGLGDLAIEAPRLRIHLFEARYVLVRTPLETVGAYVDNRSDTYELVGASLRLSGAPAEGFVAAYAREGAWATLVGAAPSAIAPSRRSDLSTARSEPPVSADPFASREHARQVVDGPHALSMAPGSLTYEGPLLLKLKGLRLEGRSAAGAFVLDTRRDESPDAAGRATVRWAVLEAAEARMVARADTAWQVAWREASASWRGEMSFLPLEGHLAAGGATYVAPGGPATVEGRFAGALGVEEGPGGETLMRLTLDGDVARTTLAPRGAATFPVPRTGGLLVAVLAAVGVGGLGFTAGALFGRRRGSVSPSLAGPVSIPVPPAVAMPFSAEDCCDAGAKAASEEDWAGAAKWFTRARTLAPTSARVCADLGFSLSQIGDVEEALRMYAEASRLSGDGEADFNGALAALHGARPMGEIEEWLERALARTPGLVVPLEADDDFRILHGRSRYEQAVGRAWQALARGGA